MATETIRIIITETGGRRVVSQLRDIGTQATTSNASLKLLRTSLIGLGGVNVLRNVVNTLADFGQAMATVRGISQATDEEFARLTATAKELGSTTRFSATEAAEGLLFLSRAGFNANQSLGTIDGTLRLAQAGSLSVARAADIATNVLQGFSLPVSETARVVDVLALATNRTNTSIEQLGDALKFVAPVAKGTGVSLEDTVAAIGTLSNAGLQASIAGTGLRRVLAGLEAPTGKTKAELEELNVQVERGDLSVLGLFAALGKLGDAGVDVGRALDIFGQRGGPAFEVLRSGLDSSRALADELRNAEGTAQTLADIMDDTLRGALFRVRSAFEAVILATGDSENSFGRILRSAVESLAESLRFLARNFEIVQAILLALAVRAIPTVITAFRSLTLAVLASPVGIIVTLAAAIGLLVAKASDIRLTSESFATLGDAGRAAFELIREAVQPVIDTIVEFVDTVFSEIGLVRSGVELNVEGVLRFIAQAVDRVTRLVVSLAAAFRTGFAELSDDPEIAFRQIFNSLIEITERGIAAMVGLLQSFGETFLKILRTLRNVVEQNASGIAQSLRGNLSASRLAFEAAAGAEQTLLAQLAGSPALLSDAFRRNTAVLQDLNLLEFLKLEVPPGVPADLADAISTALQQELIARAGQPGPAETFLDSVLERAESIALVRRSREAADAADAAAAAQIVGTPSPVGQLGTPEERFRGAIGGFRDGFAEVQGIIEDFSDQAQATIVNAFGASEDAIVEFVQTGKFNFSGLIDSILADLTRLLFRQALFGLLGAFTGGSSGASSIGGFLFGGQRQDGGPVSPGRSFLVGERGPELFMPSTNGQIIPNGAFGGSAPQVNITIVNQLDPQEMLATLNTPDGENVIVNAISKKRRTVREVIQS